MTYGTVSVDTMTTSTGQIIGASSSATMKNRIINGAMVIDQRNAGASLSVTTATPYTLDRWQALSVPSSIFSVQQNAGAITPPTGFTNYLGVTSSSAYSVGATDRTAIRQIIEGYNIADLGWGTANAKAITLSFWVRSSLTGTFGGTLVNGGGTRSYPFTYTISSANTWTQISITVAGDTTGTWATDNSGGLNLTFGLGVGSTYSGTAGAWAGALYYSATGATSVVGTNGATFYITGVQLEVGSTATSFDYRPYGTELNLCQRYFRIFGNNQFFCSGYYPANNSALVYAVIPAGTPMRATPTASAGTVGTLNIPGTAAVSSLGSVYADTGGAIGVSFNMAAGTAGQGAAIYTNSTTFSLSAEL